MRRQHAIVALLGFAAIMIFGAIAYSGGRAQTPVATQQTEATETSGAEETVTPGPGEDDDEGQAGTPEAESTPDPVRQSVFPLNRAGPAHAQGYVVKVGDHLAAIAQHFGIDIDAIAALNRFEVDRELEPGETIFIPDPTPTPLPTATPTPTPTPVPTGPSTMVTSGARNTNMVALTFDMNGAPGLSDSIVRWLVNNEVPATIFVTGGLVDNSAFGREVVRLVDTNRGLLELGNHSYSHPQLTPLSEAAIRSQLLSTESAVARVSTLPVRPFFRPPYGAWNNRVLQVAGSLGYSKTVMWDVDPQDWRGHSASYIRNEVVSKARGGSIVLLHLHGVNTEAALPGIVNGLRQQGYVLVKLSDMLD